MSTTSPAPLSLAACRFTPLVETTEVCNQIGFEPQAGSRLSATLSFYFFTFLYVVITTIQVQSNRECIAPLCLHT